MAVFEDNPKEWGRLDWRILINGSISLYYNIQILNESIDWFLSENYIVYKFDSSRWKTEEELYLNLKETLNILDCDNLNALNDSLRDIEIPNTSGVVFVFLNFEKFVKSFGDLYEEILNIIEKNSRRHLLTGNRLITLIQSNDPNISFKPVGASSIIWNNKEWYKKDRGI